MQAQPCSTTSLIKTKLISLIRISVRSPLVSTEPFAHVGFLTSSSNEPSGYQISNATLKLRNVFPVARDPHLSDGRAHCWPSTLRRAPIKFRMVCLGLFIRCLSGEKLTLRPCPIELFNCPLGGEKLRD